MEIVFPPKEIPKLLKKEYAEIPTDEFRLAITMAGAASAGCYTGGVMDYLFEIMDLWERAKNPAQNPELEKYTHLVPKHKVIIDALGGTSAGGMTATMSAIYALNGKISPVKKPGAVRESKNNIFYDSWVLMDDINQNDKRETFEKIWDTDDLDDGLIRSILNSKFIDLISDRLFIDSHDLKSKVAQLPSYISPNLQVILSHCLLRGIPLEVNFETPIGKHGHKSVLPNHTTYEHYMVSHYHLNNGKKPNLSKYLWLNPYDVAYSETLKLATKATGAFPVGLLYREFSDTHFNNEYLRTTLKRIILGELGNDDPDPDEIIKLKYLAEDFSTATIDGGAINNEPYREVNALLKDKYGPTPVDGYPRYGVVMIDPFPDRAQTAKPYEHPYDLIDVVPSIIGTLTDQSRIKRREVLENDSLESFRSIIFPRKWRKSLDPTTNKLTVIPDPNPLACSAVMAFAGLLDVGFRQHDYFLGRNNARNFFRFYFSLPYDPKANIIHPIHQNWTEEMVSTFLITKEGQTYLPIIPDLNLLLMGKLPSEVDPYQYDISTIPAYNPERLFANRDKMTKRFLKIIELAKQRPTILKEYRRKNGIPEDSVSKTPVTDKWMKDKYRTGIIGRLFTPVKEAIISLVFKMVKKSIASRMTKSAISYTLKDLEKNSCL